MSKDIRTKVVKRADLVNLTVDEIRNVVVTKFGLRKANILMHEESYRIVKKSLTLDKILAIQKEACIRVVCGQHDRKEISILDGLI